jgi:hypothetical protein
MRTDPGTTHDHPELAGSQELADARNLAALIDAGRVLAAQIAHYAPSAGEDDDEAVAVRLADLKSLRAALASVEA